MNPYHHHSTKYHLLAYCIMLNHVHVLFQPIETEQRSHNLPACGSKSEDASVVENASFSSDINSAIEPQARQLAATFPGDETSDSLGPLARIMHSLKSYTANEANRLLNRKGQFWQHESYDHWVRDEDELERIVNYTRRKMRCEEAFVSADANQDRHLDEAEERRYHEIVAEVGTERTPAAPIPRGTAPRTWTQFGVYSEWHCRSCC